MVSFLPFISGALFIFNLCCYATLAFNTSAEEQAFVRSILDRTTNHTPHSNMRDNTVNIYLDLYQLLGIDEKEGVVNLKVWLYVTYYLDHLVWDPASNGITVVIFEKDTLWTPDLVFFDVTDVVYDTYDKQALFYFGGVAVKSSNINLKLTCSVSVKYFPFDTQDCKFAFGQWIATQASYRLGTDPIYAHPTQLDLWNFRQSGQWFLEKPVYYRFVNRTFKNLTDFWNYDSIEYELTFRRHPTYYLTVILVPAVLMGFLSVLSLLLPVECGEKVSLGVTILLAQVVELLVLSDILPASDPEDFPIAGLYVIFLIILVSVSVIVCVIVSTVYYTPACKNMPAFMTSIISSRIMDILFIAKYPKKAVEREEKQQSKQEKEVKSNQVAIADEKDEKEYVAETTQEDVTWKCWMDGEKARLELNSIKWQIFAALVDRFFLICYTIAITTGTIYYYLLFAESV